MAEMHTQGQRYGVFCETFLLHSAGSKSSLVYIIFRTEIYMLVLFTNPSARAGYDTRSNFKRSLTGFNSEFSFS